MSHQKIKRLFPAVPRIRQWGLVTAHIHYHMPDHQLLLQEYLWQDWDVLPEYPRLGKFLDFWTRELDGPLHSVDVVVRELVTEAQMRNSKHLAHLH